MAEELGEPFNLIPPEMYAHFSGGIAGYGSLCGCLSVAASAIGMVSDNETQGKLTRELFKWYKDEAHPCWTPEGEEEQPQATVNSVLCHVSVTKWLKHAAEESGERIEFSSPERGERCARVTAATCKKAIELLNAEADGVFESEHDLTGDVEDCMTCHNDEGNATVTHGSDSCLECHSDVDISDDHGGLDINEMKDKIDQIK